MQLITMTKPNIPESKTIPIAESGSQGGISMWPSEEWASKLSDWANIGLIASLIAGVISTVLLVWMGNVKETYLKRELGATSARAAEADAKAEGFRLDIVKANENTAKLAHEAAAAKLETEKLKQVVAWRVIPPEAIAELEKVLSRKPGSVNLRYTDGDPEALFLAIQISQIFEKAKWQVAPGAEKFANAIQFGIALPDSAGADAQTLRSAFVAAKLSFSTGPLPQRGVSFSVSTIPGAPILMVGSRMPVHIP